MSKTLNHNLSGVAETLLCIRAMESQRSDALIKDEQAVALVRQMDQDFLQKKLVKVDEETRVAIVRRSREIDRYFCLGKAEG